MSLVTKLGAERVEYCLASALPEDFIPDIFPKRERTKQLTLIWAGKLTPNKALRLTLEAFSRVNPNLPIRLCILGGGPHSQYLSQWLAQYNIQDRADYLGPVNWLMVKQKMLESGIFIFSSLRDSNGVRNLEAMALRLPVITLDHQGASDLVTDFSGIKIAVTTPAETVKKMTESIEYLYNHPEKRELKGRERWKLAKKETWSARARKFDQLYRELVLSNPPSGKA